MTRLFVAVALVLSLVGCSADVGDETAAQNGVLMSTGAETVVQKQDEVFPTDMGVAYDTADPMVDYDLTSRIYDFPEESGGKDLPFEDMSIFDVTSASRTDAIEEERLYPDIEEQNQSTRTAAVVEVAEAPKLEMRGTAATAGYLIQLGALPSQDSAQREWSRIESRHPDLVRDRSPTIIPVELNSQMGTVFRLRTGPFGELTQARTLCAEFRSQKQDCFVVKANNPG